MSGEPEDMVKNAEQFVMNEFIQQFYSMRMRGFQRQLDRKKDIDAACGQLANKNLSVTKGN